ncbi:MAG: hypothetical protein KGP14_01790 [Betaproteobacteria bacterium]|nr:hypothetical protein [Betaproteobacteria bacterium]
MSDPFLITSLPRSKTAWMSVVTSTTQTFCRHEPIQDITQLDDLRALWHSDQYRYVGVSDSAMGFFMDWIMAEIKPRTLIIDRDLAAVERSILKRGIVLTNYCEVLLDELRRWRNHPLVMCVDFDQLGDIGVMERVWGHLMPSQYFDRAQFQQLAHMNIQADYSHSLDKQAEKAGVLRDLFRPFEHRFCLKKAA